MINKLRLLTELDIKNNWYFSDKDYAQSPKIIEPNWQNAVINEKGYLVWEKGNKVRWFAQKIIIPHSLDSNYSLESLDLRLFLTWWAESAQIFVNGQLKVEGDLFDSSCRLLVTENVKPHQEFLITIRLVSPNHDIGGLMISQCVYEAKKGEIDPSFVANELTVLSQYLDNFHPDKKPFLDLAIQELNWEYVDNKSLFHQELANLREKLLPLSDYIKERCFYPLGHAHLDMAWLWTLEETYDVAQRTFNSVLNLQKEYKYLTFGHTTAYLYQWIESHNLSLFNQIKNAIASSQWEILGGMWIEPEVNLISGESLVRQLLYGQKYFKEKFGKYNKVAWLPDTFGFPWQLPQILKQAEIEYFVTGKLHWNDTNKFAYGCFWWQSPDGSQILTLMSPPNVTGVMDTNPITMTNYSIDWEKQTGLKDIFWLPGVGDHGGGPTRDMLEVAQRYDDSPFFPKIKFSTAEDYLNKISTISPQNYPVWNSELYLELHRGCYTTHGDQKYQNRYCEKLLYQAELFSTIATILHNQFIPEYQVDNHIQSQIEANWQKLLLNQFHDILPGTSITPVFTEANQLYQEIITSTNNILSNSLDAIASYIKLPNFNLEYDYEVTIFNSLNWIRSEIVELDIEGEKYKIYDGEGKELLTQISHEGKLLFLAENVPSVGYKSFYLTNKILPLLRGFREDHDTILKGDRNTGMMPVPHNRMEIIEEDITYILENDSLRVIIDEKTGNIDGIFDKVNQREIIKGEGNELQLFEDKGQYWDAWNIDPNYENYRLDNPQLVSINWLEKGILRQRIRVIKTYNKSEFIQDYILDFQSPILKIKNKVNWQEDYTLLKVSFPFNLESDYVTYEIACGNIQRTTKPQTDEEKAQWEVYGHHWADLTDNNDNYGVSLLNDCKYGYDAKPNQLRLSLLRSPKWPDPKCDRGFHEFSYGIYGHKQGWKEGKTVQKGYEFNISLLALLTEKKEKKDLGLKTNHEFINIEENNFVLMTFKQAEKDPYRMIIRGYECEGKSSLLTLKNEFDLKIIKRINVLENDAQNVEDTLIKPYEIFSLLLAKQQI
ncbi:alpha-mannosidase [Cyanobacterium aponinum FACHB-4101]|uniref:alpha-mannosidase n=1 Tax=Cyanobacterium aponinum TaxID=379064 RepID=UPI0016819B39|nr:alpha-mannosidase [Cyanobacterium aponinum]MBD2392834.1 alpha-mannosidase [Cyanobacterium aponinum FACHB-4101]